MFNEVPFLDRFAAAAEAGFKAVEYLFPYDYPAEVIQARLSEHGLENVLFNMPPGDWAAGERGITCIPGREREFQAGVEKAIQYARRFGTRRLHAMAGIAPPDAARARCQAALIANLKFAAEKLAPHGIILLLEAINTRDMPGFFVATQAESYAACADVGAANIRMQMDCYHMQVMEGDLATKLRRYAPHCGHIQIAGAPERHEPDTGEINYDYLFRLLDEIGYDGWLGCEYRPAAGTVEGLGWFRRVSSAAE
jgi:hydroxypyruvate isomerase